MEDQEPKEEVVIATFTPTQVKLAIIVVAILFALVLAGKIYIAGQEEPVETPVEQVENASE